MKDLYSVYVMNSYNLVIGKQLTLKICKRLTKEDIWMANTCVKRCSTLLISEIPTKTTMRYYNTPPRLTLYSRIQVYMERLTI